MTFGRKWFEPRRDWQGSRALVPVETCYRILDLYSWSFALMGLAALASIWLLNRTTASHLVPFWIASIAVGLQLFAAIFRGLPFLVRFGIFAGGLLVFLLCATAVLGVTPNWAFLVILLLSAIGLLFGTRMGLMASGLLCVLHVVVAIGWITGRLPGFSDAASIYNNFHLASVWIRVLVISAGLLAALQLLMRYVLHDMGRALKETNSALQLAQLERDLRIRSEQRFAAIFDCSPDICGITRVRDGCLLDVNRAFETQTGWTRAEAVGRTSRELGLWTDITERSRVIQDALERGELTGHEVNWSHRGGDRRAGLLSIRLMELDGEKVFNVVIRDITGRRRRERAIQAFTESTAGCMGQEFFTATAQFLATALEVRHVLIVELKATPGEAAVGHTLAAWSNGPTGELNYVMAGTPCENVIEQGLCHYPDRVAELFPRDPLLGEMNVRSYLGLPIRDNAGQSLGLVAVLDDKPMPEFETAGVLLVLAAARAAAELQRLRTEEHIFKRKADLEVRVAERTADLAARVAEVERLNINQQELMRDLRVSQMAADRSAARLQEVNSNLMAANQELEAFSYSVSHDMRAPLRNITGFLELLRRRSAGCLDAEANRFISVVTTEATRMGVLIDDLLTFSRIGRTEIRMQSVDLTGLVAQVKEAMQTDVADRTVEWQIAALPTVRGDPQLLHQVLANLIGNALKFTRRRPVARIEIGVNAPARGERMVTVFVRDNGAGFNPKYIGKLFGVFQRLHNSRDFEGTGIGLANVKRIVTRHGGRVWADGAIDRGATFYFTLGGSAPTPS